MSSEALPSSLTLKWIRVNDWLMATECGRFRCRKFWNGGDAMIDPGELRYQLYGPDGMRVGPPCDSFAGARGYAERKRA